MKKIKIFIILFLAIFSTISYSRNSENSCRCVDTIEDKVFENNIKTDREYAFKANSYLKSNNDSIILKGTIKEKAIILVHGFIASPYEVKQIGQYLNNLGYTVYMPLLNGFGGQVEVANLAKLSTWRKELAQSVELMSKCYSKITLGGISLGAALSMDYVLRNKDSRISNLILLSPYFDISESAARLVIGPISTFKNSIDIETLYTLSSSPDLEIIRSKTNYYNEQMPLITLSQLFQLSDEIKNFPNGIKLKIPTLVVLSQFDTTINLNLAASIPQKHFEKVQTIEIEKKLKVPHQLSYEKINPLFLKMMFKISTMIGFND